MRPILYVLLGVLLVPTVGLVGDIVTDGKLRSTVSSGAPLEVASSDMVVNLNADMVDGVEGTDIYTKAEVDALVAAAASADSRRKFYLANIDSTGAEALTACDTGFHMASIWEIRDVSNFRYASSHPDAVVRSDSGSGAPASDGGWLRFGGQSNGSGPLGGANCYAWTSNSSEHEGTRGWLNQHFGPSGEVGWIFSHELCSLERNVWCVED